MLQTSVLILLALLTSARGQIESSKFLVPALYKNCSAVPYPQTLTIYLTTQLQNDYSRALIFVTGKITTHGLYVEDQDNTISNVFEYPLIELHQEARKNLYCLNYYCNEEPTEEILLISNGICNKKQAASGMYGLIKDDPTISFIVSNKGPNFMHIYAALPITDHQNVTYHILNPTHSQENYVQAFAMRALKNYTEVTMVPTSTVRLYRPALFEFKPVSVQAYERIVLYFKYFETVWVEAEVESCDSRVTLTGTLIESSFEMAVFSVQALCNETSPPNTSIHYDDSSNSTNVTTSDLSHPLPFSFILSPLRQLPPVNQWGTLHIVDLKKLSSIFVPDKRFFVVSFSILSAAESFVTITCHGPEGAVCNANQLVGKGETWRYDLHVKSMLQAEAVTIEGNTPIMVLHEVYSQGQYEPHHSELLQPTNWFLNKQMIPIMYSLGSHSQTFVVSLVIPNEFMTMEWIVVWDNRENTSPSKLDDYDLIKSHSYSTVKGHTLVNIVMDSRGYEGQDYVVQFAINHTDQNAKFGASIFSYGGYSFSNGYIRGNNAISSSSSSLATVIGTVAGVVSILLVSLSLLVLCYKRGLPLLPWLPLPPTKGFEFDVFLSFADDDRDFVQKVLHEPLSNRGYKALLHLTDFIAGMSIEDNIIRAVDISRVVLYVCSKSFTESSFCQTELKYGMDSHYNKYRGRYRRVIPVVIGGSGLEECPAQLNTFRIRPIKVPGSVEDYDRQVIDEVMKALKLGKPIVGARGKDSAEDGVELTPDVVNLAYI